MMHPAKLFLTIVAAFGAVIACYVVATLIVAVLRGATLGGC